MKIIWWLSLLITFACVGALFTLFGLFAYHNSFDPYNLYGIYSVENKEFKDALEGLYQNLIVGVFVLTVVAAVLTAIIGYLKQKA